eukprot:CAMPEP_0178384458 /NCGR_PEP_ID=MMETSP0689_2-20121128/7524_1 /TAXON_ID=160604 /ORGANISM="Amphidinium massartii, Strain CS-259" /LENGTH=186 /DNA_ID=CAMNT_0020004703 /DNA_START=34 /DNA_END=592 /DNA_ORIENTATION=+
MPVQSGQLSCNEPRRKLLMGCGRLSSTLHSFLGDPNITDHKSHHVQAQAAFNISSTSASPLWHSVHMRRHAISEFLATRTSFPEIEALDQKCCESVNGIAGTVSDRDEGTHQVLVWDPDACKAKGEGFIHYAGSGNFVTMTAATGPTVHRYIAALFAPADVQQYQAFVGQCAAIPAPGSGKQVAMW